MRHALTLLVSALVACSSGSGADSGADMAVADLATPDNSQDLAGVDLAVADLEPGPDLSTDGGAADGGAALNLKGVPWELINDVGENRDWSPTVTLTALDVASASVAAAGTGDDGGNPCTCNAYHAVVPLGSAFDCATATIEFDYTTSGGAGGFGPTNTTSLLFKLTDPSGGGGYLSVSEQPGASACAASILPSMQFPSPALLHEGHNAIATSGLTTSSDGACTGLFSSLDIALEAYACSGGDSSAAAISNVWVY